MFKRLVLCLAVTTGFSLAQAPTAPAAVTVYLSPFLMTGDYKPVPQEKLNETMLAAVKSIAPDVKLTVGPTPTRVLQDSEVVATARTQNCRFAIHGTVEFNTSNLTLNATGGYGPAGFPDGGNIPQGAAYRYQVTVKGNADVHLLSTKDASTLADQPESLWRSQVTQAPLDTEAYDLVEEELAGQCVEELSKRLITHLKQRAPKDL